MGGLKNEYVHNQKHIRRRGLLFVQSLEKNRTFWMCEHDIRKDRLFKTKGLAERSLKRLLEIMEDYKTDTFQPVKITESGDIEEL